MSESWHEFKNWRDRHFYESCDRGDHTFRELLKKHCQVEDEHVVGRVDLGDAVIYRYSNGSLAMNARDGWGFGWMPVSAKRADVDALIVDTAVKLVAAWEAKRVAAGARALTLGMLEQVKAELRVATLTKTLLELVADRATAVE